MRLTFAGGIGLQRVEDVSRRLAGRRHQQSVGRIDGRRRVVGGQDADRGLVVEEGRDERRRFGCHAGELAAVLRGGAVEDAVEAIVGGVARFNGNAVMVLGHQKGRDTKEKILRNWGMPRPEGYRKALRLMRLAEKFGLPLFTFIDTPGHEAFTAMRARGAKVTDAVVLVVAASDEVRPQTVEAINHAKAASVPLIAAINKVDVAGANPDLIRKGLSDAGVLVETWGGKVVDVEISAKKGMNVDKLLEMIVLEAELLDLRSAPSRAARTPSWSGARRPPGCRWP